MLGYGGTDKPLEPVEYSTKKLSADLVALLDLLGIQQAVYILYPLYRPADTNMAISCILGRCRARLGLVHCSAVCTLAPRASIRLDIVRTDLRPWLPCRPCKMLAYVF